MSTNTQATNYTKQDIQKTRAEQILQAQADLDATNMQDIQLAYDEVFREHQVRERCFPRWVKEGRMSKSDATDRLDRQKKAMKILYMLLDSRGADMPDSVPF